MPFSTEHGALFGIIGLNSKSPEQAGEFYSQVLGWQVLPGPPVGSSGFFMMRKAGSEPQATITDAADDTTAPVSQWIPYIAVDDIRAVAARCVDHGGAIVSEIRQVSDDDPGLLCTIRDPEGAMVGLLQVATG